MSYGINKTMDMCVMAGCMCMMPCFCMQKTTRFSCHADALNMRMYN